MKGFKGTCGSTLTAYRSIVASFTHLFVTSTSASVSLKTTSSTCATLVRDNALGDRIERMLFYWKSFASAEWVNSGSWVPRSLSDSMSSFATRRIFSKPGSVATITTMADFDHLSPKSGHITTSTLVFFLASFSVTFPKCLDKFRTWRSIDPAFFRYSLGATSLDFVCGWRRAVLSCGIAGIEVAACGLL